MAEEQKRDCPEGGRRPWAGWVLFLAVLLLAFFLRLPGMGRPVWIDEALTLDWAGKPVLSILRGNLTPVMPLTVKGTLAVLHSDAVADEVVARIPHLLFGLAGIGAVYLFLLRVAGLAPAVAAGLYLATLPKHIAYSQDARYYALSFLMAALFLFFSHRYAEKPSGQGLLGVGVSALVAAMNHLSFLLLMPAVSLATVLLLAVRFRADRRGLVRTAGFYLLVVGLSGMSPFALSTALFGTQRIEKTVSVLSTADEAQGAAAEEDSPPVDKRVKRRLSPGQYYRNFVWHGFVQARSPVAGALLFAVLLAGFGWLAARNRPLFILLACVFFLPSLPMFFITTRHVWVERYFVVEVGVLAIAAGCGVRALAELAGRMAVNGPLRRLFGGGTVGVLFLLVLAWGRAPLYADRHGLLTDVGQKSTARYVAGSAAQNDTVVFFRARPGWSPPRIFKYYMGQYCEASPSVWRSLRFAHTPDYDELLRRFPDGGTKGLWVVTEQAHAIPEVCSRLEEDGFDLVHSTPQSLLWRRPASRTNLLAGGDFEGDSGFVTLPAEARIVEGEGECLDGRAACVSVSAEVPGEKHPMPTIWFSLPPPAKEGVAGVLSRGNLLALSFFLKCHGVIPGENPTRAIRVIVEGRGFFADYMIIEGTVDWRPYELLLEPGTDFPENLEGFRIGIGNRGGSGTFWLDNVQLKHAFPNTVPGGAVGGRDAVPSTTGPPAEAP